MPVEIKELIVRATIISSSENNCESKKEGNSDNIAALGTEKAIIRACVEEVLKILERKKER